MNEKKSKKQKGAFESDFSNMQRDISTKEQNPKD